MEQNRVFTIGNLRSMASRVVIFFLHCWVQPESLPNPEPLDRRFMKVKQIHERILSLVWRSRGDVRILYYLIYLLISLVPLTKSASSQDNIDFARDIRPILSENCSFCHGPDDQQRQADLRLDTSEGAWSVIDQGDSEESELFQRLISEDAEILMPPPDSNRELSERDIQLIKRWIDQGAQWEEHWSFKPIKKSPLPTLSENTLTPVRNEIDLFIQKKLQGSSLSPAEEASRQTLIRRLYLDLTGLPPTREESQEYLDDTSPDAYEKLVDRVLESKHFGQRMAWDWLDAARYADTNGYQGDRERTMWPWRDWVVKAFNDNLPYDQFTRWQLAGDLLPNSTHEQKLATAFNRNHMINGEGGRIAEENRVEYVMDMTETMGTIWLGMTLNCCRCHDHKYDPILNEEYYQLFAFFNQTSVNGGGGNAQTPPVLASPTDRQQATVSELQKEKDNYDLKLATRKEQLAKSQAAWEETKLAEISRIQTWIPSKTIDAKAEKSDLKVLDDRSVLAVSKTGAAGAASNDTYTVEIDFPSPEGSRSIAAARLDTLLDPSFNNSLSHSDSGNFVLTEITFQVLDREGTPAREEPLKIKSAEATFEQGSHQITNSYDGDPTTGWAVYEGGRVAKNHAAVFRFDQTIELNDGERLQVILAHDSIHDKHNIGRFLISTSADPNAELTDSKKMLVAALRVNQEDRSEAEKEIISTSHQNSDDQYTQITQRLKDLDKRIEQNRNAWPKVMVMADQPNRRKTFLLERGLYNQPKHEVDTGFPNSLLKAAPEIHIPKGETETLNRLDLAKWLTHPDHPLTARVTVNRFWQQVFGVGLVKTTEDFGTQGETPIHLHLLDWLARDFIDNNWNVKALIRLMVTSHTYRQKSVIPSAEIYELDPENRLLSRAPRYRLPAWMIRDQALAVSGLLSPEDRGASVNTYQPPGVWEEASFGKKQYRQDTGEKLYRRSLYVFWRRIIAPTMFFDNASRQTCTVRSGRTNTPLHALQTLNGTTYVEAARKLAERSLNHKLSEAAGDDEFVQDQARINFIFNCVLARDVSDTESEILQKGLVRARSQFADTPDASLELLSVGESPRDETLNANEHAAWTSLCLAVLNLDETLNRE